MKNTSKIERKTGKYQISQISGEKVKAFIPYALPPKSPKLQMAKQIESLLGRAEKALEKLNFAAEILPSVDWFIYAYVRKEAVTSSQIEGTQATLSDLLTFETDPKSSPKNTADLEEICNYLEAIKYAKKELKKPQGLPISMRLLNNIHKRLMRGVRGKNKQPGAIRKSQNWIGGSRPGNAMFVPPPPETLAELLSDFEKFIHEENRIHPLVKIALLHLQFESIHPYLDGNGRIGRLLIALLLEEWNLLKQPLLYLSHYLKRERQTYYRLLSEVRTFGNWEAWIEFFLQGIFEIANEATELAHKLSELVEQDREKILSAKTSTMMTLKLAELLPLQPIVNLKQSTQSLKSSKPTAIKAITQLEKLGIIKEMTGKKRDRFYCYVKYLELLKIGTEIDYL